MPRPGTSTRQVASRRYYEKHRDEILASRKQTRGAANERKKRTIRTLQAYVTELKTDKPCADCGKIYPPYVMDFDHVRGVKVRNIARIVKDGCSREMLDEEIAKCELVCSNCHRIRTHTRDSTTT